MEYYFYYYKLISYSAYVIYALIIKNSINRVSSQLHSESGLRKNSSKVTCCMMA